jgi:hypothetical protein
MGEKKKKEKKRKKKKRASLYGIASFTKPNFIH